MEPKPHRENHPLGRVLLNYINLKSKCYDPEFDKEISDLRPDWFINQSDIANQNK